MVREPDDVDEDISACKERRLGSGLAPLHRSRGEGVGFQEGANTGAQTCVADEPLVS